MMPFFPSLPDDAGIRDVYNNWRDIWEPFDEFSNELMRGPSPLMPGERELIAGYTSGLNACEFCHGSHTAAAVAFGIDEHLMEALLHDIDSSPLNERLKPIFRLVRKLTLEPYKVVQADVDAILAAGWDEKAFHDAVAVCARYNLVNRIVEGHGVEANPATFRQQGEKIAAKPYRGTRRVDCD